MAEAMLIDLKALLVEREDCDAGTVQKLREALAQGGTPAEEEPPSGVQPAGGRSGRTPAEPYPPDDAAQDSGPGQHRPAEDHPWRRPFRRKK